MLLCLLLLVVGFRAAIPVGYMPDPHSLRQGMVRITLCTALGAVSTVRLSLDDARQTGWHTDRHTDRLADVPSAHGHPEHTAADASAVHLGAHGLQHAAGHGGDKDDAGHDHAAGAECPFWAAAHLTLNLPPGALVPLAVAMDDGALPAPPTATLPPQALAGPPLGSRAPPRPIA
ncbi:DUF2946 domain-containing protein [Bordetella flabilis]